MNSTFENGSRQTIDGVERIFYDGYWIKYYEPPQENLTDRKRLIQSLTRRLFNHMEHGINIPGQLLDEVRASYEAEDDPRKKRVKGAMVAGALFNRAADIFNQMVEMEAQGIKIDSGSALRSACGDCLKEALEYGKMVKHRNGDEGIDELWGEPFKAFAIPINDFYMSRYIKIAITMRNIDEVASVMVDCVRNDPSYQSLEPLILDYAANARRKCETLRTDNGIFDVWSEYVAASELIEEFEPVEAESGAKGFYRRYMLDRGVQLIDEITRARTAMPKSTLKYLELCGKFKLKQD